MGARVRTAVKVVARGAAWELAGFPFRAAMPGPYDDKGLVGIIRGHGTVPDQVLFQNVLGRPILRWRS